MPGPQETAFIGRRIALASGTARLAFETGALVVPGLARARPLARAHDRGARGGSHRPRHLAGPPHRARGDPLKLDPRPARRAGGPVPLGMVGLARGYLNVSCGPEPPLDFPPAPT